MGALNARRTHGHRLGARQAGGVSDTRPGKIRRDQHGGGGAFGDQQNFLSRTAEGGGGLRVALGILSLLRDMAEFARSSAIEGALQGLRGGHHLGVIAKHLRPANDLHDVPDRAVSTEPGEQEAGDGEFAAQLGQVFVYRVGLKPGVAKRPSYEVNLRDN